MSNELLRVIWGTMVEDLEAVELHGLTDESIDHLRAVLKHWGTKTTMNVASIPSANAALVAAYNNIEALVSNLEIELARAQDDARAWEKARDHWMEVASERERKLQEVGRAVQAARDSF